MAYYNNTQENTGFQAPRKEYTREEKILYICKKNWTTFNSIADVLGHADVEARNELIYAWATKLVDSKAERQFVAPTQG